LFKGNLQNIRPPRRIEYLWVFKRKENFVTKDEIFPEKAKLFSEEMKLLE
jgi:hypothetical protein